MAQINITPGCMRNIVQRKLFAYIANQKSNQEYLEGGVRSTYLNVIRYVKQSLNCVVLAKELLF